MSVLYRRPARRPGAVVFVGRLRHDAAILATAMAADRRHGVTPTQGLIIVGRPAPRRRRRGGAAYSSRDPDLPAVTVETLRERDLDALVSASGKIQPKRQVNVSANTMGRVTRLAVQEGQRVKAGQFLLEIDPRSLEGQLQRGEASVAAARSSLQQARTAVEQARATLELARQNLKRQDELWKEGLTTRESLERAQNEVTVREAELKAREQEIQTREEQIKQEQAGLSTTRYNLSQVIISSPMDGIITRRNIEEGENVIVGTMNNAGTVLLTIADMSVIEAEIEVDETDIPTVTLGQPARITIDAVPDRMFRGRVTEIGNSPIQTGDTTNARGTPQATNFKVVDHAGGGDSRRASGVHLHRGDHDRDAQERRVGADPGADRARDAVRREGRAGPRAAAAASEPLPVRPRPAEPTADAAGTAARLHADGDRGRVRLPRRPRRLRADQGRHRRRALLRGAVRRERRAIGSSPGRSTRSASWPTARRSGCRKRPASQPCAGLPRADLAA